MSISVYFCLVSMYRAQWFRPVCAPGVFRYAVGVLFASSSFVVRLLLCPLGNTRPFAFALKGRIALGREGKGGLGGSAREGGGEGGMET